MSESYQLDSSEIAYRKKKRFVLPGLYRLSPGVIDAQKKFFSPMLFVGMLPQERVLREQPMSAQELIGQELIPLQRLLTQEHRLREEMQGL